MTRPLVSVVMAAYNAEATISQSIESVLDQTYEDWELVIVDDFSGDGTYAVARSYADSNRIRVVRNVENLGGAASRHVGFDLARGEYVAIQDADDVSSPLRLETQVRVFSEYPDTDVVGGQMADFGLWGGPEQSYVWSTDPLTIRRRLLSGASPIADPTAMIRRSVYLQVGGYDISLRRVYDLALYLKMKDRVFRASDTVLVHYRTKRPLPLRYCLIEGRYRELAIEKYLRGRRNAPFPGGLHRVLVDARSSLRWLRRRVRERA